MATIAIGISPKAGGGATTQVPVNALAEDGVPPEEGDSVSFSVEGKVESVSGSMATVSIDSINGEPVGEESSESSEEEQSEGQAGGGSQAPEGPSGASPRTGLDVAPMGGGLAGAGLARNRLDRKGTALMRQRLLKGARNQPLPF
jgi:hypothetical protein